MDNEIAVLDDVNNMTNVTQPLKVTGLGKRLKTARESMNLSEKEAAARLYLNPKIISYIENEKFSDGPPITFMRGYLRSYAKLLNVPESEIKAELDEIELSIKPVHISAPILHASPINKSERYIRWITYLIVLTLLTLVCIWWSSQSHYLIADVPAKTPFQAPPVTVTKAPPPPPKVEETVLKPEFNIKPQPAIGIMIPSNTVVPNNNSPVVSSAPVSPSEIVNPNARQRDYVPPKTVPAPGVVTSPESG
jgi:cytoskeleton protein RodZ